MTATTADDETTMTVLAASQFGSPSTPTSAAAMLSFTRVSKPRPESLGPTEVIIRVAYSELNPVDHHKLRANKKSNTPRHDGTADGFSHRPPLVVGFGGSGIVDSIQKECADAETRGLLGKKVVFIANPHPSKLGSYAEYIVCDRRVVTVIPENEDVDLRGAASVPIAGCTAFESLTKAGFPICIPTTSSTDGGKGEGKGANEGKGKRLLIIGGSGGVGSWTTQLARTCYPKLEIICTASTPSSSQWCLDMGADRILSHDPDHILSALTDGPKGSVDGIVCLTEPTPMLFNSIAEVLRPFGKICLVVAGEGIKALDLSFVFYKSGTVATETVFSSIRDGYRLNQSEEMGTILSLMGDGRAKAPLVEDEDVDWQDAVREGGLIDMVGSGHCRGKLIMRIAQHLSEIEKGKSLR